MASKLEVYNDHKLCKTHIPYVLSNWCYVDSLDGEELKEGEKLVIVWADGMRTEEKLIVDKHKVEGVLSGVLFGTGPLQPPATLNTIQQQGDWHSIPGFISTRLGLGGVGHLTGTLLAIAFVIAA